MEDKEIIVYLLVQAQRFDEAGDHLWDLLTSKVGCNKDLYNYYISIFKDYTKIQIYSDTELINYKDLVLETLIKFWKSFEK